MKKIFFLILLFFILLPGLSSTNLQEFADNILMPNDKANKDIGILIVIFINLVGLLGYFYKSNKS